MKVVDFGLARFRSNGEDGTAPTADAADTQRRDAGNARRTGARDE